MKEIQMSYKQSSDSWQMKVHKFLGLPFPFPWLIIAGFLFVMGYGIFALFDVDVGKIRLLAIKTILIAAIANAVVFFERLLDEVADVFPEFLEEEKEKSQIWVSSWYENIFWSEKNIIAGFVLGFLVAACSIGKISNIFDLTFPNTYIYFVHFIIGFLGGSMFWTMLGIARLTNSLGKDVKIKPSIFDSNTSSLRAASNVLWKVSLTAALVYLLGISPNFFYGFKAQTLSAIVIVGFGVFVVLYFIIPQTNIHKTLLRVKRERLAVLVNQIDATFDRVAENPTQEDISQLRELFDLQHVVNGRKSWSFGMSELLILLGTVIIPLIIFIIDSIRKSLQ